MEKAKELYELAIEIKEKHYGKGHIQTASTILNLGVVYRNLGNLEKAKELYELAIEIEEKHYGKGHIKTASTILNLGGIY